MKIISVKSVVIVMLTVFGLTITGLNAAAIGDENKKTTTIKVSGMTCSYCAKTVEECIGSEVGVTSVKLDLATGLATVTYDENKTSPETISKKVKKETYFDSEVVKEQDEKIKSD